MVVLDLVWVFGWLGCLLLVWFLCDFVFVVWFGLSGVGCVRLCWWLCLDWLFVVCVGVSFGFIYH